MTFSDKKKEGVIMNNNEECNCIYANYQFNKYESVKICIKCNRYKGD